MIKQIASALACAFLCAFGGASRPLLQEDRASALTASTRVLFLGNSLTATRATTGDDMPAVLSLLAASRGRALSVKEAIDLGHTLQESWDASIPQPYLAGGGQYDAVVYQEYSTLALTNPDAFFRTAITTYQPSVQKALKPRAQMVLFENWALQNPPPSMTRAQAFASLHSAYAQLSTALSTSNVIAPFADAWEQVFARRPQSFLFLPDGKHPNNAGIYLNACLMYATLYGESPVGLPALFLSGPDAAFLQGIAARFTPAAPSDAGVDAGVAATGATDAGVAGASDAGIAHAGATDGAVPPAGSDGGVSDTGNGAAPDAGAIAVHAAPPPASNRRAAGGCASGGGAQFPALALLLCLLWQYRRRVRAGRALPYLAARLR